MTAPISKSASEAASKYVSVYMVQYLIDNPTGWQPWRSDAAKKQLSDLLDQLHALHTARQKDAEMIAELKRKQECRDDNWIDQWGCCKVCDGEIPHGHTNSCDIYKKDQLIASLTKQAEELKARIAFKDQCLHEILEKANELSAGLNKL
jgi:DNA repair exonuclease SbcCD ATPase subunit